MRKQMFAVTINNPAGRTWAVNADAKNFDGFLKEITNDAATHEVNGWVDYDHAYNVYKAIAKKAGLVFRNKTKTDIWSIADALDAYQVFPGLVGFLNVNFLVIDYDSENTMDHTFVVLKKYMLSVTRKEVRLF